MRKILFVVLFVSLLTTTGMAADIPDGTSVDLSDFTTSTDELVWDTTSSYLTTDDTSYVYWTKDRELPKGLDFSLLVSNAKAIVKNNKAVLKSGDVTLLITYKSGDIRWEAKIPMEQVKKKKSNPDNYD